MEGEKRKGDKAVPDNINEYLNEEQLFELHKLERFGWYLKFIRRPLFQMRIAAVINGEGNKIGILEEDGTLNMQPEMVIR